mgnify:FL=1
MIYKFNDGYGAVLCSRCGKIVYSGTSIPEVIRKRIRNSEDVSSLPDVYCPECSNEIDHIL